MKKINVISKFNNKPLSESVFWNFPNLSKSMFFKALRQKDIKVNENRVKENVLVKEGDLVEIYISDEYLLGEVANLEIVYEDENILAVNKKNGISVTEEKDLNNLTLTKIVNEKLRKKFKALS